MNLKEIVDWMQEKKYIYKTAKGGFLLTTLFHEDLEKSPDIRILDVPKDVEKPIVNQSLIIAQTIVPTPEKYQDYKQPDWTRFYQDFIITCQVPAKLESTSGNLYSGNKYSEEGMKAFQKALKDGHEYEILVGAVALYYKSRVRWKKAIGTYMTSGEWRSDYAELISQAQAGGDALNKYIKKEADNGSGTRWEFG